MEDGRALMVGEEHRDLLMRAALGDEAVVRRIGQRALLQTTRRSGMAAQRGLPSLLPAITALAMPATLCTD